MATILIVEDDPHISRVVSLWLTRNGHKVITATNGTQALEVFINSYPDLIVTDVNMPGKNGLELLAAVVERGFCGRRVILLTSRCDQAEIEAQASNVGAVVHPKPFSPVRLTEAIEAALSNNANTPDAMTPAVPVMAEKA